MRPIKTITYSSHFERAFHNLPTPIQVLANKREKMFRRDCFDPRLKTHKLAGEFKELWSFSINYQYRIVFRFLDSNSVYFIETGDHSIYQ